MKRAKIACVFGTRPEAIKMAPIILALQSEPERFEVTTINTGQHRELLVPIIEWFGLDIHQSLDVMTANQKLNGLAGRLMAAFGTLFTEQKFDCVIGQGDTTTVFTAALAAFHERIPFAHIEAGLRTHDLQNPFPEEMNRVMVGRLAHWHFAPTDEAAQNLLNEGIPADRVQMVGNTVIDALEWTAARLPTAESADKQGRKAIFVTAHRRENFGEPLLRICAAIKKLAADRPNFDFVYAVHPNPNVKGIAYELLSGLPNVKLIDPVPYAELVAYLQNADLILTDSGGLQEEAPALKKPVLVLREETERPELVTAGGSVLVGSDDKLIYEWVTRLLTDRDAYSKMVIGYSPYGDGKASLRIKERLAKDLSGGDL